MQLLCSGCGNTLTLDEDQFDRPIPCPHCGRAICVPGPDSDDAGDGAAPPSEVADEFLTRARLALKNKLLVDCPACARKLTVEQHLAGKTILCPACREPIDVPSLSYEKLIEAEDQAAHAEVALTALDVAGAAGEYPEWDRDVPTGEARRRGRRRRAREHVHWKPVLIGIALAVLAGGLVGYQIWKGRASRDKESPVVRAEAGPKPTPAPTSLPIHATPEPKPSATHPKPPPKPPAPAPAPPATPAVEVIRARLAALVGKRLIPAGPRRTFLELTVRVSAGSRSVTLDPAGQVVLRAGGKTLAPLRAAPINQLVPVADRTEVVKIPPTTSRTLTFRFHVPESFAGGKLTIAGVGEVEAPHPAPTKAPPPAALAGTYREVARHLRVGFEDPVMEQVRRAGRHRLVVTSGAGGFSISLVPTKVRGRCRPAGNGLYVATLTDGDNRLDGHLRLVDSGRRLVLYLAGGPYHQVVYERR